MKMFSQTERRGVIFLVPLLAIVILLVVVYEMLDARSFDDEKIASATASEQDSLASGETLRQFNPNRDEYEQLRESGVPVEVAVGIVRWRKYGKIYRIVEDMALVAGVNDSLYAVLKPYVTTVPLKLGIVL